MDTLTFEVQTLRNEDGRPTWRWVAVQIPTFTEALDSLAQFKVMYPDSRFRVSNRGVKAL